MVFRLPPGDRGGWHYIGFAVCFVPPHGGAGFLPCQSWLGRQCRGGALTALAG